MRRSGRGGPSGLRNQAPGWQIGETALGCSVTAMAETVQRLSSAAAMDLPQALAVISEAVWWVTIVEATMIRYHRGAYDHALAALDPAARQAAQATFAGLRFVRSQMGYRADPADFIQPQPVQGGTEYAPVAKWIWKRVPAPELEAVPRPGRGWEISRTSNTARTSPTIPSGRPSCRSSRSSPRSTRPPTAPWRPAACLSLHPAVPKNGGMRRQSRCIESTCRGK